ncbi:hypothetical protein [Pseudomonas orientalis]|uniref:Uncharacterized protein n=1 Tax=Pseudomonas orientalis TaxID=76758 RepID=A0A8B3Y4Y6_9PSED|nr:hypothetical protein [Pseudomonas orientalis]SDU37947.1 hypothetical protein SAMN04490197_5475 [Pseudomonas orientalis]
MSNNDLMHLYDVPLSDKEALLLGRIIALWGALESEVFAQTIATFNVQEFEELPRAMNNLSFIKVLELWKARVAEVEEGDRAEVLTQQFEKITRLHDSRNALIHGMWTWSMDEPEKISTTRVSKKQIITMHFPAGSLADFHDELSVINAKIKYPGGVEDTARERENEGVFISRRMLCMLTNNPAADDWLPPRIMQKGKRN